MYLNLFVGDESIDRPWLSRTFVDEIVMANNSNYNDFLNEEEKRVLMPNLEGEIILKRKREATPAEIREISTILNKAINGQITDEVVNEKRDKLFVISNKIEDRERDSLLLKTTLKKIEDKTKSAEFADQFKKCYNFLDSAIIEGKKVLWELSPK